MAELVASTVEVRFVVDRDGSGLRNIREISKGIAALAGTGSGVASFGNTSRAGFDAATGGAAGFNREAKETAERTRAIGRAMIQSSGDASGFASTLRVAEGATSRLGTVFTGAFSGTIVANFFQDAARAALDFGAASIKAANDAADARRFLDTASRLSGTSSGDNQAAVERIRAALGRARAEAQELLGFSLNFTRAAGRQGEAEKFLIATADTAVASGRKLSELRNILQSLQGGGGIDEATKRLLGKNPSEIYEAFAKSVNKSADALSVAEQRAAIMNAVLERGGLVTGAASERLGEAGGRIERLTSRFEDLKVAVGEVIERNQGFGVILDSLERLTGRSEDVGAINRTLEETGPILRGIAETAVIIAQPIANGINLVKTIIDTVVNGFAIVPSEIDVLMELIKNAFLRGARDAIDALKSFLPQQVQDLIGLSGFDPGKIIQPLIDKSDAALTSAEARFTAHREALFGTLGADVARFTEINNAARAALEAAAKFGSFDPAKGKQNRIDQVPEPDPDKAAEAAKEALKFVGQLQNKLGDVLAKVSTNPFAVVATDFAQAIAAIREKLKDQSPELVAQAEAIAAAIRDASAQKIQTSELEKAAKAARETAADILRLRDEIAVGRGFPDLKIAEQLTKAHEQAQKLREQAKAVGPAYAAAFKAAAEDIERNALKKISLSIDEQIRKLDDFERRVRGLPPLGGPATPSELKRLLLAAQGTSPELASDPRIDIVKAGNDLLKFIEEHNLQLQRFTFAEREVINDAIDRQREHLRIQKETDAANERFLAAQAAQARTRTQAQAAAAGLPAAAPPAPKESAPGGVPTLESPALASFIREGAPALMVASQALERAGDKLLETTELTRQGEIPSLATAGLPDFTIPGGPDIASAIRDGVPTLVSAADSIRQATEQLAGSTPGGGILGSIGFDPRAVPTPKPPEAGKSPETQLVETITALDKDVKDLLAEMRASGDPSKLPGVLVALLGILTAIQKDPKLGKVTFETRSADVQSIAVVPG